MTVEELIERLSQIEDKNMTIFAKVFDEYQDRITQIEEKNDGNMNYVVLS